MNSDFFEAYYLDFEDQDDMRQMQDHRDRMAEDDADDFCHLSDEDRGME